ncbi:MAG: hypothetical protein HOP03_02260 [Lysobacter sp.]|nr:hypothetical protein [Lysobacter sp.]
MKFHSLLSVSILACAAFAGMAASPSLLAAENPQEEAQTMDEPLRRDDSFKLPAGQAIQVDNAYGSVYLRFGGYEDQLDIRSTVQQPDGAATIVFTPAAREGRFEVAPKLPDGIALAQGQRIDLVLYVPKDHPLTVRTGFGSIESRGLKSDIDLGTDTGDIAVRGTEGTVQARTGEGKIEVSLSDSSARPGSVQRMTSRTGNVAIIVSDKIDVEATLSTSNQFATDYSLTIVHHDGKEPNKVATAVIGKPKSGKDRAQVVLESLVGEVRVIRKGVFVDPE